MGMVSNKIEVMVLNELGKTAFWDLFLDNEIETLPTNNESLFADYSSAAAFADCIGRGFKDTWEDYSDGSSNFIEEYCESFEDSGYKDLKRAITKLAKGLDISTAFKKVIIVSNNQGDNGRELKWNLFDLESNSYEYGFDELPRGTSDCEAFMKSKL